MSTAKLAFPGWAMGQVLLPEQFVAQQETIVAHIALRAGLSGMPAHGLARLRIDEELLASGSLRLEAMTYVFASGLLVDVPGNTIVSNANLAELDGDEIAIYLHVGNETTDARGLSRYEDDPRSVRRVVFRAELLPAAQLDDARESAKLLELRRRNERWELGDYAPPLLGCGPGVSPFLRRQLLANLRAVRAVDAQLTRRIKDAFLGQEQVAELRRVSSAAQRVLALLADHGYDEDQRQQVALHPYVLFSALRDFYLEAAILQTRRDRATPRYRHEDLSGCFVELQREIEAMLGTTSLSETRLEFERRADWYIAGPFPEPLGRAREVFLVVKPKSGGPVGLEGVKLASPQRIDEVYSRALAGVPLTPMSSASATSFAHVYGYDAVFYEVGVDDLEWRLAAEDGAVCFPALRELESITAALVWST